MSVIVIDLSSVNTIEAGFAGDEKQQVQIPRSDVDSWIQDMGKFEHDMRQVFSALNAKPQNYKVLMSRPVLFPKKKREQLATLMFETFQVQAFSLVSDAVLVMYGMEKVTGTVVSCNAKEIVVSPIYESFPLVHAIERRDNEENVPVGEMLWTAIEKKCDLEIREDLYRNIVVVGDNAPSQDKVNQWESDIIGLTISRFSDLKIAFPENHQDFTWQGGSRFALDPSLQGLWFAKAEYKSYGATLVHRRCVF